MRTPVRIEQGIKCCASTNVDKCTGCPYEGFSGRIGCRTQLFKDTQDYLKAIRKSAAQIKAMTKQLEAAQPKWISVEERLPEPYKDVLVLNWNRVRMGYYAEDCEAWAVNDMITNTEEVTHWMPLPEPPEEV